MSKVRVRLNGGFGNQCFCYAAARALSIRTGAKLELVDAYAESDFRQFALGDFNYSGRRVKRNGGLVRKFDLLLKNWYKKQLTKTGRDRIGNRIFDYYGHCPDLPVGWRGTLDLDGFFQSERLFWNEREQIVNDFTLRNSDWLKCDSLACRIANDPGAIACHFRSYKDAQPDGSMALPVSYYENAFRVLAERVKTGSVYVFSDELDWAMERMAPLFQKLGLAVVPVTTERKSRVGDDYTSGFLRDFTLMRICRHAVIPNSTFSWWAAWLMEQRERTRGHEPVVIFPAQGEGFHFEEGRNMCPVRWMRITPDRNREVC